MRPFSRWGKQSARACDLGSAKPTHRGPPTLVVSVALVCPACLCLALAYLQDSVLQVQILPLELSDFLAPHSGIQSENGDCVEGSPVSLLSPDERRAFQKAFLSIAAQCAARLFILFQPFYIAPNLLLATVVTQD
jgi:hypothetical protein